MALEKRKMLPDAKGESKALEFARFIKKVRAEGGYVSNEELLKFSKLFEDELTLDNLGMSQLRSLCRLMTIQPLGSPEILRFQLNMKLRELKADDKMIASEGGVEKLSTIDLQAACRARGMRSVGLSEERLRDQLRQWLELSLNDKVPPAFLLLSRTLYLPEDISFTDRLKTLIQSLPDGIAEQTRQKLTELEGGKVDHKARLDLIKQIEDAIQKEKQLAKEKKKEEEKQKKVEKEEKPAEEIKVEEAEVKEKVAEPKPVVEPGKPKVEIPVAPHILTAMKEADQAMKDAKEALTEAVQERKEQDLEKLKMDSKDLSSIEEIIVGGPIHEAKHDIIGLKEKVIEHTEDLLEISALDAEFAETKVAKRLRNKLNSMIENVDTLVEKLEEEKRAVKEEIADPAVPEQAQVKHEKTVRIQDIIDSLEKLKLSSKDDEERKTKISHLLKVIDKDEDGIVDKDIVLEVIALLEKHSDVEVSASQIAWMVGTLQKEDKVETLQQKLESAEAGNFDIPPMPSGPSSAAAFMIDEETGREGAEQKEKRESEKDEDGQGQDNVDLPKVDKKVTTILGQQKRNGNGQPTQPDKTEKPK
ncbi:hypothetical protein WR25_01187 isoform C [Diploscapter pachys]|uniref:Mitochondrial proton/calcium exchanger protein n=1 Tax=Diploscapter pachys TaxID=2018661 RepID=A0A2A2K247_9BILA|nr:hypothetical protein WR25_01187 isoform A [Diploscapter pachys]PAV67942.1 hypothetical protein WR25_01187 isoform B [Diploscapter pachys]PAV67943.1 hypothetical protein WR25_01187 isoform C [Diploscapter pachys]